MHVILMAPHFPQYQRHFARALSELGVRVTGIGDWPWDALDDQLKSWLTGGWWQVPAMQDEGAIRHACRTIHDRDPVDQIAATIELQMLTTARIREELGIPGQSVESVLLCRDKIEMKKFLSEKGIPCAKHAEVNKSEDCRKFVKDCGYPVILKPRDMAGAFDTHVVRSDDELEKVMELMRIDEVPRFLAIEEFIQGEEGFYDTLVCDGKIAFEAIAFYYPNVLHGMRERWISPQIVTTNDIDNPEYAGIRELGRQVNDALQLPSTGTHMEWFKTERGYIFSEIAARPAGVRFWDIYCWCNEFDLYKHWAEALVNHKTDPKPSRRYSAGLIALRPSEDGHIRAYSGVDEVRNACGDSLGELHLPHIGAPTQPIENGYMANAYAHIRHHDYDECRRLLNYTGETLKVWAS